MTTIYSDKSNLIKLSTSENILRKGSAKTV